MPRSSSGYQSVQRGVVDSVKVNSVSEGAEVLFYRLLCVSDDYGRYHGDAFEVAARACTKRWKAGTVTVEVVEARLAELERAGLIGRYGVGGEQVLEIANYKDATPADRRKERFDPRPSGACPQSGDSPSPIRGHDVPERSPLGPLARGRAFGDGDGDGDGVGDQGGCGGDPAPRPPAGAGQRALERQLSGRPDIPERVGAALRDWARHREEMGKALTATAVSKLVLAASRDPTALLARLESSTESGTTVLVSPSPRGQPFERLTAREASDRRHSEAWSEFIDHLESQPATPCSIFSTPPQLSAGSETSATLPTPRRPQPPAASGSSGSTPR